MLLANLGTEVVNPSVGLVILMGYVMGAVVGMLAATVVGMFGTTVAQATDIFTGSE